MSEQIRKWRGVSFILRCWGLPIASLVLFYSVTIQGLKAQAPVQQPAPGGDQPPVAPAAPPPPAASTSSSAPQPQLDLTVPAPTLERPKPKNNEISASGDFMLGQGTVTLPFGYSLSKSLGGIVSFPKSTFSVPRNSVYYGGTISYSYGQAWYVDFSYAKGNSSGSESIYLTPPPFNTPEPSTFSIDDTWYQIYLKYAFPQLSGKRLSAYLRAGATYITADIEDNSTTPFGAYKQTDTTTEIQGNLGFGLGYSLYTTRRWRLGLQFEGEGFFGERTQTSLEKLSAVVGIPFESDNINNTLYGGLGRATVHVEYRMGRSGLFKIFGEGGLEGRYMLVTYPGAGSPEEYLWGPYVKLGLRYAF